MKSTLLECCNWNDINFNYDYNYDCDYKHDDRDGGYCLILIYPPKIACVDMVSITLFCYSIRIYQ